MTLLEAHFGEIVISSNGRVNYPPRTRSRTTMLTIQEQLNVSKRNDDLHCSNRLLLLTNSWCKFDQYFFKP